MDFKEFLIDELRDLYSAEQQLLDAMPQMIEQTTDADLSDALTMHLEETRTHKERLERIFSRLDESPNGEVCEAMEGLIREAEGALEREMDGAVRDAAIIGSAQRIEHYEIAGYGTARTHAAQLGMHDVAQTLQETLDEEGNADKKLSDLAIGSINEEAVAET